jgi:DNA polymerase-3 subunit gamma/tau
MAYVALYRKYRSQSFSELMGQDAVTTTLQNALKTGRFAHAYLFHGARGCGKTSTARLVARALNCIAQDGPTPEPCGKCRLCVSIREGNCLDVVEIDAASETSIDDVREKIIENVQYSPAEARYKVYIIDEVHDLSAKAFDALLKTLEEPPAHVVFILATTEWHKVPITIRSRCQPFAFHRGTVQDLARAVQRVVDAEGYKADPEAVQAIARAAEGSWRDALSLLEQVLSYSDGHITPQTVYRAVGTVGLDTLMRVTDIIAAGQWDAVLGIAGELIAGGTDARQILMAIHGHLRDLMVIAVGARTAAENELGAERVALLEAQAQLFTPNRLLAMMIRLAEAEREVRFTNHTRWLLEGALLNIASGDLGQQPPPSPPAAPRPAPTVPPAPVRSGPVAEPPAVIPRPPTAISKPLVPEPSESESVAEVETPAEPKAAPSQEGRYAQAITLEVLRTAWPRILKLFHQKSPNGYAFLQKATPLGLEGTTVILGFPDVFARDRIQDKGRDLVQRKMNEALNTEGLKIRCVVGSEPLQAASSAEPSVGDQQALLDAPPPPSKTGPARIADFDTPAPASPPPPQAGSPPAPAEPPKDDLLNDVLRIFGGEVVHTEEINEDEDSSQG